METYWITGVQVGMLRALAEKEDLRDFDNVLDSVIDKQQCDNKVREEQEDE